MKHHVCVCVCVCVDRAGMQVSAGLKRASNFQEPPPAFKTSSEAPSQDARTRRQDSLDPTAFLEIVRRRDLSKRPAMCEAVPQRDAWIGALDGLRTFAF